MKCSNANVRSEWGIRTTPGARYGCQNLETAPGAVNQLVGMTIGVHKTRFSTPPSPRKYEQIDQHNIPIFDSVLFT
jgi:hypothetical protein